MASAFKDTTVCVGPAALAALLVRALSVVEAQSFTLRVIE
jgi:hypothetical protein